MPMALSDLRPEVHPVASFAIRVRHIQSVICSPKTLIGIRCLTIPVQPGLSPQQRRRADSSGLVPLESAARGMMVFRGTDWRRCPQWQGAATLSEERSATAVAAAINSSSVISHVLVPD